MSGLAAVVLAAGVSSRMGAFKPLLMVDGQTMIQRVVSTMRAAGARPIVVVTGYHHEKLEEHLVAEDVVFVHNERYYETQMLDSLLLGLSALGQETQRVLMCPADIPLVKEDTIRALLASGAPFVRPMHGDTPGHPVVLDIALREQLRCYQGNKGLRDAVETLGIRVEDIPVDDFGTTLDSDARDEYAALLHYQRQQTNRPQPLQLDLRISLQAETTFWGADCAQFLEMIDLTGSMVNACQSMHMSYSRGWRMINEIEHQLGYPVLARVSGGPHGGGSELTAEGKAFLHMFQQMYAEIHHVGQAIFQRYFGQ